MAAEHPADEAGGEGAPDRSFVILVNPSAGGGRGGRRIPDVREAMDRHRLRYEVAETRSLDHGAELARAAVAEGRTPVVMSGDGLIGRIGGELAGTDAQLGIIPGGRGNDFARVVGIPTDPAEAVAVLARGDFRVVDVGEANGVRFLCIASCGFDSDANRIANEAKLIRGPLVYAYAALRALIQWKPANFELRLDDREHSLEGFSVAVANSKAYGGGMFVAPDAELDDGLLDVVVTAHGSKFGFLRGLPDVFDGSHVEREQVSVTRATEVEVSADRDFAVYADGEHITDLPATIRLLPSALRVIAPPAS